MTENKFFSLETIDLLEFYGPVNQNLEILTTFFPHLKIVSRGEMLKVSGSEKDIAHFEQKLKLMIEHYEVFGQLKQKELIQLLESGEDSEKKTLKEVKDVIIYGRNGKMIKAKTANQQRIVDSCSHHDLVFAIGPAGTGKTYTAVALAIKALKNKEVKRIILARPAVEAGENLGFLPGDLRDKLDPYLQPLYDALRDMLPHQKLVAYLDDGTIEIAPLAFMRGRTLNHAFAILDEAQNASTAQLKMFLTRMGTTSKFIVTGDVTQIDLPKNQQSGLLHAEKILKTIKDVDFVWLDQSDVVRHDLVVKILNAYSLEESKNKQK
jgi:phosphate starvation-inducible PhoH-like protein